MSSKRKLTFLIDCCVSAEVSEYLATLRKVKVISFTEAGLTQNSDDTLVIEKATRAGAMLITGDKRFTEKHVPFCTHEGIIKFGVKPAARLRILRKFLKKREKHLAWKGVTYLLEDQFNLLQHGGDQSSMPY